MRPLKIFLILAFSIVFMMVSGCEKDSVQESQVQSPTKSAAVVHRPEAKKDKTEAVKPKVQESKAQTAQTSGPIAVTPQPAKETAKRPGPATSTKVPSTSATQITKPQEKQATPVPESQVAVQVLGYQGDVILSNTEVTIKQGDTALLATEKILQAKGIPMSVKGSGSTAYVEGIDNVFEFDHGPESGWHFLVNGKMIGESAGSYKITKGDHIVWKYSTDVNG